MSNKKEVKKQPEKPDKITEQAKKLAEPDYTLSIDEFNEVWKARHAGR